MSEFPKPVEQQLPNISRENRLLILPTIMISAQSPGSIVELINYGLPDDSQISENEVVLLLQDTQKFTESTNNDGIKVFEATNEYKKSIEDTFNKDEMKSYYLLLAAFGGYYNFLNFSSS